MTASVVVLLWISVCARAFMYIGFTCGHTYCSACIDKLLSGGGNKTCPGCRMSVSRADVVVAPAISLEVQGAKIHCPNYHEGKGCNTTMAIGKNQSNVHVHLKQCEYEKVQCVECKEEMERRLLGTHANSCAMSYVSCTHCRQKMLRKDKNAHESVSDENKGLPCRGFCYCPNRCTYVFLVASLIYPSPLLQHNTGTHMPTCTAKPWWFAMHKIASALVLSFFPRDLFRFPTALWTWRIILCMCVYLLPE
jgi:hypothetical protein